MRTRFGCSVYATSYRHLPSTNMWNIIIVFTFLQDRGVCKSYSVVKRRQKFGYDEPTYNEKDNRSSEGSDQVPFVWCQPRCADVYCPRILLPVCASNGRTYANFCELFKAICMDPRVKLVHEGQCRDCGNTVCPMHYDPVCGTDGHTYGNECQLSVAACRSPYLRLAYTGSCWGSWEPTLAVLTDFL